LTSGFRAAGVPCLIDADPVRSVENAALEWNAWQFHRTLFARSNPDRDKQFTELRNGGGFAERNQTAKTAKTRV
jgi:hypothetical protein